MIHTVEFYINITHQEKMMLEAFHQRGIKKVIRDLDNSCKHLNLRIGKPFWNKSHNIYLQIDVIELLERDSGIITESDYDEVYGHIQELEQALFGALHKEFILNRIDYRLDLKVPNQEHRAHLFKLWRKLADKYGHLNKRTKKKVFKKQDDKDIYVHSKQFKTTIYIASKALVVCVYDKEAERIAKKMHIKEYEKDVIRFEVRLMARHLAYKARSKKIERSFAAYFSDNIYNFYIQKYVLGIFGTGHFYKINKVREALVVSGLSGRCQEDIVSFLKDVSRKGIEGVIGYRTNKKRKNGYSRYHMKKYKMILDQLQINMIMLPIRVKVAGDILINPLQQVHLASIEQEIA